MRPFWPGVPDYRPMRVYEYLKTLSSRQIIHYIPRKDVPVITFLEERLDEKNLLISPERYKFRKERYEKRIEEMIRYATSESLCQEPVSAWLFWSDPIHRVAAAVMYAWKRRA